MKHTWWYPDTCTCKILYEWDQELPQEKRVMTPIYDQSEICAFHKDVDNETGYNHAKENNDRQREAYAELKKNLPAQYLMSDPNGGLQLKDDLIQFAFVGVKDERTLHVTIADLPEKTKTDLQTVINEKLAGIEIG